MSSWPRISIVTPSFNQGDYIEETITSVLEQGYPNLEYVVVDGGSHDRSVEIIRKYEKHLTWWVSEPDDGQTDAINKGFARTSGTVFNWLNSDDAYAPGALRSVAECFADPAATVVSGRRRLYGEGFADITFEPATLKATLEETLVKGSMDQPATFFRREVYGSISPLSTRLRYTMDTELWLAYLLLFGQDGVRRLDKVLVNARLHEDAKTLLDQEGFFHERLSLYGEIAEALQAPADLHALFEELGASRISGRHWKAACGLETQRLFALLDDAYRPFRDDRARLARELAAYFLQRGAAGRAMRSALGAVRAGPASILNYRTLLYCVRRAGLLRLRRLH